MAVPAVQTAVGIPAVLTEFSLQRFCVGDRFYLHENKILCEYDYEEQMALSQMQQQQQQFYQSLEQSTKSVTPCHEFQSELECGGKSTKSSYAATTLPFAPGPSHFG